jgi:hypothetical protein
LHSTVSVNFAKQIPLFEIVSGTFI